MLAADVSRAQESGRLDRVRATRGVLYRYDAADNLLQGRTLPTQINALNQLRRWAGEDLAHDANGNLVADGRWRYRYDAENRLVAMQAQDAGEVETGSAMTAWAGVSARAATTASATCAGAARASAGCAAAAAA